jgi:hypothetical protein
MKQVSKILAILLLLQIHAVFAQEEEQIEPEDNLLGGLTAPQLQPQVVQQEQQSEEESGKPSNTITYDLGPTIIGIAITNVGKMMTDGEDVSISGFGFGLQYERQIIDIFSVAGRFSYLSGGVGYTTGEDSDKATAELTLSSWAVEAHPRLYPFAGSFFLDGMLGFSNMSTDITGYVETTENGIKKKEEAGYKVSRGFLKYGAKLGWRINFGESSGFVLEHSYGWAGCSGSGDTFGKQLNKKFDGEIDVTDFDDLFEILENWLFVGGPRVTLAIGWRF